MESNYLGLNLPKQRYFARDAGLFKRFLSLLVDLLVLEFIAVMPFSAVFTSVFAGTFAGNLRLIEHSLPPGIVFIFALIVILALVYLTLFQYYFRQTIGMMLTRTYVEGDPGFFKCLARSLFVIPAFPFYVLWIVEPIHVYLKKQSFVERLTSTRTVEYFAME